MPFVNTYLHIPQATTGPIYHNITNLFPQLPFSSAFTVHTLHYMSWQTKCVLKRQNKAAPPSSCREGGSLYLEVLGSILKTFVTVKVLEFGYL